MSRSDLVCPKCGESTSRDSTFCISCGKKFSTRHRTGLQKIEANKKLQREQEKQKFYRRLPMRMITIVILVLFDWFDNRQVDWAYYPGAAIAIFAILIPIIRFREDLSDQERSEEKK